MKYSPAKHFWTWFRKYSEQLLLLPEMEESEKEYWCREIGTHLRSYTKNLSFELVHHKDRQSNFIITACGNEKYFRMAERMAAKAPRIVGWEIIGLQPPGLAIGYRSPAYAQLAACLNDCWFKPPQESSYNGKKILTVYLGTLTCITGELLIAADIMVLDLLGEKTWGLEIDEVRLGFVQDLSLVERASLIGLQYLPQWIKPREYSNLWVNSEGKLERRK